MGERRTGRRPEPYGGRWGHRDGTAEYGAAPPPRCVSAENNEDFRRVAPVPLGDAHGGPGAGP